MCWKMNSTNRGLGKPLREDRDLMDLEISPIFFVKGPRKVKGGCVQLIKTRKMFDKVRFGIYDAKQIERGLTLAKNVSLRTIM